MPYALIYDCIHTHTHTIQYNTIQDNTYILLKTQNSKPSHNIAFTEAQRMSDQLSKTRTQQLGFFGLGSISSGFRGDTIQGSGI